MKTFFISIQATYSSASLSLFSNDICLETALINDTHASSHLIFYLETLLKKHALELNDLAFIAIDQGPGAFTSLRVSIATVNGIAFGKRVPLVGVNGLDALGYDMVRFNSSTSSLFVSMLNAYNNDVYYVFHAMHNQILTTLDRGCKKIEVVLDMLNTQAATQSLVFAGNGAYLHRDMILTMLGDRVRFVEPILSTATSESIGVLSYNMYKRNAETVFKIEPTYMKTQYFAIRNSTHQ